MNGLLIECDIPIWLAAKPWLDVRSNDEHTLISYRLALALLHMHPEVDQRIVLRAVLMHDVGWKMFPEELLAKAAFITIIDHHASAEKDLDGLMNEFENVRTVFDMAHSGAALTWEVFHAGKPVPYFVRVVEDRDLWLFKLPGTRELCDDIFSYD